jgi:signal transduction histidine kinase
MSEVILKESPPRSTSVIRRTVPWRSSIYLRVILLCVVLLCCLLGSVTIITRHFYLEAIQDMEARTSDIAQSISLQLEETPDINFGELSHKLMDKNKGWDIQIQPDASTMGNPQFNIERHRNGEIRRVARVPLRNGDRQMMLTASITIVPQVEILRAFRNRSMMVLTGVFVVTLGLMIYFIIKALHPLARLSESCTAISAGNYQPVSTRGATGEIRALEETFNQMVESLQEKEHMEVRLRHAQRLSALGNLAAGVAHDVRNPLNAIKLLSSHALDTLDDQGPSNVAKSLQTIRKEVERLEGIVSGFLSLAKERQLTPQSVRADLLLEECIQLLRQDAEKREVRLDSALGAHDRLAMLDPQQWKRAILNVLINALDASPAGASIHIVSTGAGDTYAINVRDEGAGIDAEVLEHLFEPYFSTKPGGTGLGLSITRGIIEEHGGNIELSNQTPGCEVRITLPLQKVKAL